MNIIKKIINIFTRYKNLRVILLCFLAATTFWFFNALNETYSASIRYPISFEYDKDEYIVMNELPDEVYLNLQGIGWNLFRKSLGIKVNPLRIYLDDPAEIKSIAGSNLPALLSDQLDEFQLNYVLTDSLYVNIDRKVSRTFKVNIDSSDINLAANHIISSTIHYYPDSVYLIGPEKILNTLGDTITLNLPENNIDENYNEEVPISFNRNELIIKSPETINVVFTVEELIETEAEVVVKKSNFPENAILADSTVEMLIKIRESNYEQLNLDEIEVVADYRKFIPTDSVVIPSVRFYPQYIYSIELDSIALPVNFVVEDEKRR